MVDGAGVSNFVSLVAGFESLLLAALPMFDAFFFCGRHCEQAARRRQANENDVLSRKSQTLEGVEIS